MRWRVVYSAQAKQNLKATHDYIAYNLLAPETAKRQLKRIMDKIEGLSDKPEIYPLYDKEPWKSRGLRKLIIDRYIAFYLPIKQEQQILVLSIMYEGRNIENLLKE